MEGVWSDSKTFKLIDLFEHVVYTMYSQTMTDVIKQIAHVLDITGAYMFECDYAHGRPYAHGGPYEQG